jgi:hypothetical protein
MALWVLGLVGSNRLPEIAANAISRGVESKALVELAGLSMNDTQDASRLFEQASAELGQSSMTKPQALARYATIVSRSILASEITPLEGAKRIWRARVDSGVEGCHDYDGFIYAASELEDRPEDKTLFEKVILEEAKKWTDSAF